MFRYEGTSIDKEVWKDMGGPICKDKIIFAYLPNCVQIGLGTFLGFKRLQAIYAPQVGTIGYGAFADCPHLSTIYVSTGVHHSLTKARPRRHHKHHKHQPIHIQLVIDDITLELNCDDIESVQGLLSVIRFDLIHITNNSHIPISIHDIRAQTMIVDGDVNEMCDVIVKELVMKRTNHVSINCSNIITTSTDNISINTHDHHHTSYLIASECVEMTIDLTRQTHLQTIQARSLRKMQVEMGNYDATKCAKQVPRFDCPLLEQIILSYVRKDGGHAIQTIHLKRPNPYLFRLLRAGVIYNEESSEDKCINGFRVLGNVESDDVDDLIPPDMIYPVAINIVRQLNDELMSKCVEYGSARLNELVVMMCE